MPVRNQPLSDRFPGSLRLLVGSASELLWPTRCVGCEKPATLLCDGCRASLPWIEPRWACPTCGAPFGSLTCTECHGDWPARATVAALSHEGAAARLVPCYKDAHELRLAPVLAAAVATALDEASGWPAADGSPRFEPGDVDAVTFVPATPEAYARRGFDHMEPVATALGAFLGLPVADVLARGSASDQRLLGREERREKIRGSVRAVDDVSGMSLLLVDDVLTTGSTMGACAEALLARGARRVSCAAATRVW